MKIKNSIRCLLFSSILMLALSGCKELGLESDDDEATGSETTTTTDEGDTTTPIAESNLD